MFTLPTFNLKCNIYTGPWVAKALRVANQPCNLAWGRRVNQPGQFGDSPDEIPGQVQMIILLPPLTDIRPFIAQGVGDVVECPAGSGRWYGVLAVDDLGKGFPNEHRGAQLFAISQWVNASTYPGLDWPVPIP